MRCWYKALVVVPLLTGQIMAAAAQPSSTSVTQTDDSVKALVLQWYTNMIAGRFDRSRLTPAYSAQLTDEAVQNMSRHLRQYGAGPTGAQVLQTRTIDDQTFYLVKLLFPRGDAGSVLIGFNTGGQITGLDIVSMAGD